MKADLLTQWNYFRTQGFKRRTSFFEMKQKCEVGKTAMYFRSMGFQWFNMAALTCWYENW